MYTIDMRVRFSEVDASGYMSLPSVINYFQDCSTWQSEDIGLGFKELAAHQHVWVLSSWQVVVKRYPALAERIRVSTWATGFEGIYGIRNFLIEDETGEKIAYANSIWVFMDAASGRPSKPSADDIEAYGIEPALEMQYAPRKIKPADAGTVGAPIVVRKDDIDINHHMNNCGYVKTALEALPREIKVSQVRVEYKRSAVYGDVIYPKISEETERTVVDLCDESGKPFAVVEFVGE